MNIINKLTIRHIKTHMKRTVLTVMAIIVSIAMVTAVFVGAMSFINYFKEVTIAVDGNQHVRFYVSEGGEKYSEVADKLKEDKQIETFGFSNMWAGVGSDEGFSDSMMINACSKELYDLRNVVVSEGRYPEKTGEIVLTRKRIDTDFKGLKLGDKISLNLTFRDGQPKEKYEFKLVGIIDTPVSQTDDTSAFILLNEDTAKNAQWYEVYARYKHINRNIYTNIEQTAKTLGLSEEQYGINSELLTYSGYPSGSDGDLIITVSVFAGILLVIIAVVSIFMIYDSFAVSYKERAKYLGILASVGATKAQKRKSIYFEAFILGLFGIPLGILSGIGGMAVTFAAIQNALKQTLAVAYDGALKVHVNLLVIVGIIIVGSITLFLSAYIPARKASKDTPIEAIRQADATKVSKGKKLKVSKLTSKLYGFPGVMAVKNYKRNNKRSRNIVFTLFLSIVVFLAATNFSTLFTAMMKMELKVTPDVVVDVKYENYLDAKKVSDSIEGTTSRFDTLRDQCNVDKKYFKDTPQILGVIFLDNATLDDYAKQLGIKASDLHKENEIGGILFNQAYNIVENKRVRIEPFKNLKGESITGNFFVGDTEERSETKDVELKVVGQTTEPYSNEYLGLNETFFPMYLMSIDYIDDVLSFNGEIVRSLWTTISFNTEDAEGAAAIINDELSKKDIFVGIGLVSTSLASINNLLTIVKVFAYGFIALITLIAIMNIINTISNSMNERRREFAMIRSVGMTPSEFKKMIYLESARYGGMAVAFGIPVSIVIHLVEYLALASSFDVGFRFNIVPYIVAIVAVFAVIFIALMYSYRQIKEDNIIETLRHE